MLRKRGAKDGKYEMLEQMEVKWQRQINNASGTSVPQKTFGDSTVLKFEFSESKHATLAIFSSPFLMCVKLSFLSISV